MWTAWAGVVTVSDPLLDALTTASIERPLAFDGRADPPAAGTELLHVIYHYWGHIGEASAVRQLLGHPGPPEFVGDIDRLAPWHGDR
jgi:hypothetical protein